MCTEVAFFKMRLLALNDDNDDDADDGDDIHLWIGGEGNHCKKETIKVGEQVFLDQWDRPEVRDQWYWEDCVYHLLRFKI